MNSKDISNDQFVQELADEIKMKIGDEVKDSLKEIPKNILFTDKEVKASRTLDKLNSKEFKIESKISKVNAKTELLNNSMVSNQRNKASGIKSADGSKNTSDRKSNVKFQKDTMNFVESRVSNSGESNLISKTDSSKNVMSEKNKRTERLDKKIKRADGKSLKKESQKNKYSNKRELIKEKRLGPLDSDQDTSIKGKKSKSDVRKIGERNKMQKVLTSPMKSLSAVGGKAKAEVINKSIAESDDEGLKFANNALSKSGTVLKKQTVKTVNRLGFDRKAYKNLRLSKKENKLTKKINRSSKGQLRSARKKMRATQRLKKGSIGSQIGGVKDRIISLMKSFNFKGFMKSGIGSAKFMALGSGAIIFFLSSALLLVPMTAGIMAAGAGGGTNSNSRMIYEIEDIKIDLESPSYQDSSPYTSSGLRGQCTWYVWGRIHELYGASLPTNMGNGGEWINSVINDKRFIISDVPATHSIMVQAGTEYGHVTFVESYDPSTDKMIISEGNIQNPKAGEPGMVEEAHRNYAKYFRLTENVPGKIEERYGVKIVGYIHLDNFVELGNTINE